MESTTYIRSPELMPPQDTVLVVVDVQERLLPSIQKNSQIAWNIRRLLDAASVLGIPSLATEHNPQGLGPTVGSLAKYFTDVPHKLSFSCCGCSEFVQQLAALERSRVLLVGTESHVCVQQTALDLLSSGYRLYVPVDAMGSRSSLDHDVALRRIETSGATLTTTEAAIFEWCEKAGSDEFKTVHKLVMESPPE